MVLLNYSLRRPHYWLQDTFCKQHHCLQWWGGLCRPPSCLHSAAPSSSVWESASLDHWEKIGEMWIPLIMGIFHLFSARTENCSQPFTPRYTKIDLSTTKPKKCNDPKCEPLTSSWIPWRWRASGHLGPGSYLSVSVLCDRCDPGPSHLRGHSSRHPWQGSRSGPSSWHADVFCYDGAQSLTCAATLPGSEEKITSLEHILKICRLD